MKSRFHQWVIGATLALCSVSPAWAAAPKTVLIHGAVASAGGGAVADGSYDMTFAVYADSSGGAAVWSEGPTKINVKGGRFSYTLGSVKPVSIAALTALKAQWLGIKVGGDPELPRTLLSSTMFSLHAGVADAVDCVGCVKGAQIANGGVAASKLGFTYAASSTKGGPASDLACTGCVSVKELKFDADVDLGGKSLKATNGQFSGVVAAGSFVGDGSKLTGIKTPAGECQGAAEVVKGINPDGSLKCVKALDPSALPKDALDEVSNGLITNQFEDTIKASAPGGKIAIPDNQGVDAVWNIDFPNIGVAQDLVIAVQFENTDLSKVSAHLLAPDDKKTGWLLCDPCGKKDAKLYQQIFNPSKLPQQEKGEGKTLKQWIGQNPTGLWTLKVKDTSFCIPQQAGNEKLCDPVKKTDGALLAFSVKIKTLSNKKVANTGDVYVNGKIWGKDNGHGKPGGTLNVGAGLSVSGDIVGKHAAYGGVFVYWAHKTCPAGSTKLYEGRGFAGHYAHTGSNRGECIVGSDPGPSYSYQGDLLYPLHTSGSMPPGIPSNKSLVCAICSWDHGSCFETWGTDKCPTGYQKMYGGYSVGPHYQHSGPAGGRYCLNPSGFDTSVNSTGNGHLYGTRVQSGHYGSSWPSGRALKCGLCCRK